MPSYKETFGSYLKGDDLHGRATSVVIKNIVIEKIGQGDDEEKKLVAHFVGKEKGLALNRTNCETLEAIAKSDDYELWRGLTVVLYYDATVRFGGKAVGGIRIRAPQAAAPPPPPPPPPVATGEPLTDDDIPF